MRDVRVTETRELEPAVLEAVRGLLDEVFTGDFSEHDWQHTLGGTHALVYEDGELVGHGSVIERKLTCGGRPVRTGYVEGMGVRRDRQRRGHGTAIMDALEEVIRRDYELGALGATDEGASLYAKRGWIQWPGPTRPDGEGAVYVFPVGPGLDLPAELAADARDGDVW